MCYNLSNTYCLQAWCSLNRFCSRGMRQHVYGIVSSLLMHHSRVILPPPGQLCWYNHRHLIVAADVHNGWAILSSQRSCSNYLDAGHTVLSQLCLAVIESPVIHLIQEILHTPKSCFLLETPAPFWAVLGIASGKCCVLLGQQKEVYRTPV